MAHIYISIGSNIDRYKHIAAGLDGLAAQFQQLVLSPVYESEAVGFAGSHFLNMVVGADTTLSIADVVATLKQIEDDNGRIRGDKKFASRTLDLDLLLYDEKITQQPIELPRAEILFNAFVLRPLADIASNERHPVAGKTYLQLWQEYDQTSQALWPVAFTWNDPQSV